MSGSDKKNGGQFLSIAGTVISLAGGPPGWAFALALAGSQLSYAGQRQLAKEAEARARINRRITSITGNVRGSYEHHNIVFGKARVGGIVVSSGTEAGPDMSAQYLHIGIAHSIVHAGGCEGIVDLWVDDTRVTAGQIVGNNVTAGPLAGLVSFNHYRGTATQTADATLVSIGSDVSTDYRRGIAWTRVRFMRQTNDETFRNAFKYGLPAFTVELKGWRCYDPRLDSTNGGSGSHRYSDPTTWSWTDNPILCAATYAIAPKLSGGWGRAPAGIDWPSVAAAANICDETITPNIGGARARYSCNGVFSTADKRSVNLQKILDSCDGKRITVGGKWKFYAGVYRTPTVAITEDWLAGEIQLSSRSPLEGSYNAVRVNYADASQDYKTIEAPNYTSSTYESQDGGQQQFLDMTLPMVANVYSAQYLAQIKHKRSRYQAMLTMKLNLRALDVEVWETCTVALPNAGAAISAFVAARVWRIVSWVPSEDGINVVFMEENAAIYTVDTMQTPNSGASVSALVERPPTITDLAALPMSEGILLYFTPPPASLYERVQVERSATGSNPWTQLGYIGKNASYGIDRETDGATWYYRVIARTATGQLSASYSNIVAATAKMTADAGGVEILNGGFEGGDRDWTKGTGWTIVNDPTNARSGNWTGKVLSTGVSQTTDITSTRRIPVAPGDAVSAAAFLKSTAGANGTAEARIVWLNAAGSELSTSSGNSISAGTSFSQSRVVATAPASAAYALLRARVAAFVGTSGVDAWFLDDYTASITPKEPYNLTVPGSGQRVGDQRNLPVISNMNDSAALITAGGNPLTAIDNGTTAKINIAAHTVQTGFGQVTYNAGSITGLQFNRLYYVYADDPSWAGGAVTYVATITGYNTVANSGRYFVGTITTPADGAGGTGGSGNNCVGVNMALTDSLVARDVRVGDPLFCMNEFEETFEFPVEACSVEKSPCRRIVMEGGAALVVSDSTPITMINGQQTIVRHLRVGDPLFTNYEGAVRFEKIFSLEELPPQDVARITVGHLSYAAGERAAAMIYTHNVQNKDP